MGDGEANADTSERRRLTFTTLASYLPEAAGGAQLSTHTLLTTMAERGWDVEVICAKATAARPTGYVARRLRSVANALAGPSRETDTVCGYPCTRLGRLSQLRLGPLFAQLDRRRPTVIATEIGTGGHTPSKLKLLTWLGRRPARGFVFVRTLSDPAYDRIASWSGPHLTFVANSPFVAQELDRRYGIAAEVLLPVIDVDRYRNDNLDSDADQRAFVTFINPVPEKGSSVFVKIAERMPDVRFLVIKGKWSRRDYDSLGDLDAMSRLPNVHVAEFTNDIAQIYRKTKILLVPSQTAEAFGRVVIEAQANAIPVVASDRGGLRDAVGTGGITVSPAEVPDGYIGALYSLLKNQDNYKGNSLSAVENVNDYVSTRNAQVDKFVSNLENID